MKKKSVEKSKWNDMALLLFPLMIHMRDSSVDIDYRLIQTTIMNAVLKKLTTKKFKLANVETVVCAYPTTLSDVLMLNQKVVDDAKKASRKVGKKTR